MSKKINHMGMAVTKQEHEKWHKEHQKMTPEQHQALMKKMGISEEEDEKWHNKGGVTPKKSGRSGHKQINCYAIGGGFLAYCVKRGWLIQEGKGRNTKYYVTEDGEEELKKFGINV